MVQYRQSGSYYGTIAFDNISACTCSCQPHSHSQLGRIRRSARSDKCHPVLFVIGVGVVIFCLLLFIAFLMVHYNASEDKEDITGLGTSGDPNLGQASAAHESISRYSSNQFSKAYTGKIDSLVESNKVEETSQNHHNIGKRGHENGHQESLDNGDDLRRESDKKYELLNDDDEGEWNRTGIDEYLDGIDSSDHRLDGYDSQYGKGNHSDFISVEIMPTSSSKKLVNVSNRSPQIKKHNVPSTGALQPSLKRKTRHGKTFGSCEVKFPESSMPQLVEPYEDEKFARFSIQYVTSENASGEGRSELRFAGHQSQQQRENSFVAHDQKMYCGFVKGSPGGLSTGFDLTVDDENFLSRCHIAVVSCIFGNSDRLRSPTVKAVTHLSRENVCFVMFMDDVTRETLVLEGKVLDGEGFIGLWKIVVVRNLPYDDMRRVGKIPKLLLHRLFPSARYSIWLDSKLRLQIDPLKVLEYFLWRNGYEYAISNHYDRHCVWEEVAQNKRLNKYDPSVIDQQLAFYQSDGLRRFNASDQNKLLPSNVPEGSLIVRAHTPMANLFSCLWFNEVDHFTPRDQLSFAYTYHKLRRMNPRKPFHLNMFKDCERRAVVKLFHHRFQEALNALSKQAKA